jgi:hypothetical protein
MEFNAFYGQHQGNLLWVVPYRLPAKPRLRCLRPPLRGRWQPTSADTVLPRAKPNHIQVILGTHTGETLSDQLALLASLRDPQRVRAMLAETSGNLYIELADPDG